MGAGIGENGGGGKREEMAAIHAVTYLTNTRRINRKTGVLPHCGLFRISTETAPEVVCGIVPRLPAKESWDGAGSAYAGSKELAGKMSSILIAPHRVRKSR